MTNETPPGATEWEFILGDGRVSFDWSARGYHRDASGWEHQLYRVTFTYDGRGETRTYSTDYRMGLALEGPPEMADVLENLFDDVRIWDDVATPGELAREFGLDDVDEVLRVWKALKRNAKQMRRLFGSDWDEWMMAHDRRHDETDAS